MNVDEIWFSGLHGVEPSELSSPADLGDRAIIRAQWDSAGGWWGTAVFAALAPSRRKEYVRQITSAKATETRQHRIGKIIAALTDS